MKKELTFLGILSLSFILLNLSNANIFDDIGKSFTDFGNKVSDTARDLEQKAEVAGQDALNKTKYFFQNLNPQQFAQNTADKILSIFGIGLNNLIGSAQAIQQAANEFSPLVNRLQETITGTNGPIDTINNLQKNISSVQTKFNDVVTKSANYISSGQFLTLFNIVLNSLKGLTANADQTIANAPNNIQQDLVGIKNEIISLNNTLNNNQIRLAVSEVKGILDLVILIMNSVTAFRNNGGALSQVILNNTLMGHLNDVKVDITNLDNQLNIILATPQLNTVQTTEMILNGIFSHLQAVPKLIETIKPEIEQIIAHIPTISKYTGQIQAQVTSLINFTKTIDGTLKQQIANVLKPEIIVDPARIVAIADAEAQAALQRIFATLHTNIQEIFNTVHSFLTDIQLVVKQAVTIGESINSNLAIRLLPIQTINAIEGFVNQLDKLVHDLKPLLP